jgi:predicted DsbA family dithiol-disulfide isomerase
MMYGKFTGKILNSMKIEIWSDVMCPFCYIGKRRFENALTRSGHGDGVDVEWKSFQLNPDVQTDPGININQYLAAVKGFSLEHAKELNAHVTQMAAEEGLTYNFDRAIVANSFNAHRFTHLAKKHGLGAAAEEQLFKAYFTDGKNIDDKATLADLGTAIGLDAATTQQVLESDTYAQDVERDIAEAQYLGIRGVPFFVLNGKYGISGAQALPVFEETINKAFAEWQQENTKHRLDVIEGDSCGIDGDC